MIVKLTEPKQITTNRRYRRVIKPYSRSVKLKKPQVHNGSCKVKVQDLAIRPLAAMLRMFYVFHTAVSVVADVTDVIFLPVNLSYRQARNFTV